MDRLGIVVNFKMSELFMPVKWCAGTFLSFFLFTIFYYGVGLHIFAIHLMCLILKWQNYGVLAHFIFFIFFITRYICLYCYTSMRQIVLIGIQIKRKELTKIFMMISN